jgi:3-oxoacyl-[acyl-carrier protein] reductase
MMKSALVTGASRGIGLAIAERFRASGYGVLAPGRAELDLSSPESVERFFASTVPIKVDILVNNAGKNKVTSIADIDADEWNDIFTVNLTSALRLVQAVVPHMKAVGGGKIVNIGSCYAALARPGRAAYSASKAGLQSLTRSLAVELGSSNILVNAVCPGFVETQMTRTNNSEAQLRELASRTALNRLAQPHEIAALVHFLTSDENTYITGQSIVIDGGFSVQ